MSDLPSIPSASLRSSPGPASPAPRALPADVRAGSASDRKAYEAALGFEQVMLGELVKAATASTPLAEGDYAGAVNDAFTSALTGAGGTGLAAQLYRQIKDGTS